MNADLPAQRHQQFVVIKSWHAISVILVLLGWLAFSVAYAVSTRDQTIENTRRIETLENRTYISTDAYQNEERAIEQRLDRIERKIDAQGGDPPRRQ